MTDLVDNLSKQWSNSFSLLKELFHGMRENIEDDIGGEKVRQEVLSKFLGILEKTTHELRRKNETIDNLKEEIKDLINIHRELDTTRSTLEGLDKKLKTREGENQHLQETVSNLKRQLESDIDWLFSNQSISNQKGILEGDNSVLSSKLYELKEKNNRNEGIIADLENQISKSNKNIQEKMEENYYLENKYHEQIKNLKKERDALKEELTEKDKILSQFSYKFEEMGQYERLYLEGKTLIEEMRKEKQKIFDEFVLSKENHQREKRTIIEESNEILRDLERSKGANQEKDQLVNEIAQKMNEFQSQVKILTNENKEQKLKLKDKNNKLKKFNQELENMTSRIKDLSSISDQLMEENESMKRELGEYYKKEEILKKNQADITKLKAERMTRRALELEKLSDALEDIYSYNLSGKK